jgi:hypothetical protein
MSAFTVLGEGISPREQALEDGDVGDALPEALARRGLPEQHAHREDVGAAVDALAARLLGRHVRDLALEHAGARLRGRVERLGDAEIDDLHLAVVGHEDVLRGDVAVHDAERACRRSR